MRMKGAEVMKYISELIALGCFSRQDVVALTGSEHSAHSLLYNYVKAGYIQRIRRDLYAAISLETKQPIANRYLIASNITEDSYVSFHSAFEYYGYANQVYYEIYVSTESRFADFTYDGITYTRVSPRIDSGIITTGDGIKITDIERTVIDSIYAFEKIGGLEELLRCLAVIPFLKAEKLITYLDDYGYANLYQKTGYLLSQFAEELSLPKTFFDYCENKIPGSKKYLFSEKNYLSEQFILHEDWMLYAPANIKEALNKGVDFNGYVE